MLDATLKFFGLTDPAFVRAPPKPYLDPARRKAVAQLQALVRRRGFAVVAGPPGSGKTALLHYLCSGLGENQHRIAYVPFSFLERGHLLHHLASQLGLEPPRGLAATLRAIQKHLHSLQPVNPVIVLDEAQRLETNTAHMLCCLLHDRADTAHHCTLIMAGTDSFVEQKLCLQIHEALRQRITLYVKLTPLAADHTAGYIAHHLHSAGSRNDSFAPPAIQLIHELANGLPRLIGLLSEAAMDCAAGQQHQTVTLEHVHAAAETVLPPQTAQVRP